MIAITAAERDLKLAVHFRKFRVDPGSLVSYTMYMNTSERDLQSEDYSRIEQAIRFVDTHFRERPDLEAIAASVHLSKYHFQRMFKRWAGISPAQFMQFLTLDFVKQRLAESRSLLDVSYDAGLSGPGRLHDLFVTFEAMTPGEYKQRGRGIRIEYGIHASPFGPCLLAKTERGICYLGFVDESTGGDVEKQLRETWPSAEITRNEKTTAPSVREIFQTNPVSDRRPFNLLIRGTNFQVNVWKALLTIPPGRVLTYGDIAAFLGRPSACRAVASAVALNPVSYLIPCHRVIAATGKIHKYRWGSIRKKAILGWEAARSEAAATDASYSS